MSSNGSGSSGQRRAEQRVGSLLKDKYRLDRVLGIGGMAAVYAATHRNQKQFAVKVLHPELSWVEDIRSRFLREGYVANSVRHPGTVSVLDDDVTEDGSAFLVMELLDGVELDQLWQQHGQRLTLAVSLAVGEQLLAVLEAAHAREIIHRDLKPANLFVLRDGQLKVLDFGIARLRDHTANHLATGTGAMMGTPVFMAPEQALAQNQHVDAQSDLWSVGATLFTLISGQFVHVGQSAPQVLVQAATQRARSLAQVAPATPSAVVELVDRALAFEKEARWPSASSMRAAVVSARSELFGAVSCEATLRALFETAGAPSVPGASLVPPSTATLTAVAPLSSGTAIEPSTTRPATTTVKPVAQAVPIAHQGRSPVFAALLLIAGVGSALVLFLATKHGSSVAPVLPSSTSSPGQASSLISSTAAPAAQPPPVLPSLLPPAPAASAPEGPSSSPISNHPPAGGSGQKQNFHAHSQVLPPVPEPTGTPAQHGKLDMGLK
jgi:serine/threonine protein kinase